MLKELPNSDGDKGCPRRNEGSEVQSELVLHVLRNLAAAASEALRKPVDPTDKIRTLKV